MMNNIQAIVDGWSAQWQRERSETQMTLGKMIAALEAMPSDAEVDCIKNPDSYRGYYADLAFARGDGRMTAGDALGMCRGCMGVAFDGYKGGNYVMGENTPVWIANWGHLGERIMGITDDGTIETAPEED